MAFIFSSQSTHITSVSIARILQSRISWAFISLCCFSGNCLKSTVRTFLIPLTLRQAFKKAVIVQKAETCGANDIVSKKYQWLLIHRRFVRQVERPDKPHFLDHIHSLPWNINFANHYLKLYLSFTQPEQCSF